MSADKSMHAKALFFIMAFVKISLVFLAIDSNAQYAGVSQKQQTELRKEFEKTSFIGHFFKMDTNGNWSADPEEMDSYFTYMFYTFDNDRNGIIAVEEAPTLLLSIRLMGKPFPRKGLDLNELRFRLSETFKFLDKNQNDELSWLEML